MAQLNYQVGAQQMESRDPMPAGDYSAMVTESEIRATQGGGQMVSLTWTILEPEQWAGRKVWSNLNLVNASAQAVEIAHKELNSIAMACGYAVDTTIGDTQMLHERICTLTLKVKPAGNDKTGQYREAKNEIKAYRPMGATAPQSQKSAPQGGGQHSPAPVTQPPQQQHAPQQPQLPAGSPGKPPWKR